VSSAYLEQPVDSDLSLGKVADNTADATALLARSGAALRWLSRANVYCRFLLGRQLLVIQERRLWSQMARQVGGDQNATGSAYRSWDDFLAHGFPELTGLTVKTGYAAVMLAKSTALLKLLEPELRKFENLGNAIHLVKLERKGVVITGELIAAAQTLPVEAFRQMTGSGKKAIVEVVVDNSDLARALQPIVDILKMADPNALVGLQEVFGYAMTQGGGNATDAVDCVNAACHEQWRQEGLPELAAPRELSQADHRGH
jgi:hypothetical protein